ncbi:MAG TPA: type II toxin-antitoxin system RelE/ParE family toxin [Pirellulaceae bacterium]|nr:type II toxin-antitoxin system RelE/ParE family toxin [Pirellulaceae bacterium]
MNLRIIAEAKEDIDQAIAWYEAQRRGLGHDFAQALDKKLDAILAMPGAHPPVGDEVRVARIKPYPYGIYYEATTDEIVVLAVLHLSRRPGIWRLRSP